MDREVGEVMRPGVKPEELAIEHVGEPRQRKPVAGKGMREGPRHAAPRDSLPYVGVVRDVDGIVIIDEAETQNLPIGRKDGDREERVNPKVAGRFRLLLRG